MMSSNFFLSLVFEKLAPSPIGRREVLILTDSFIFQCDETFDSKTKLFNHLKANPKHAAPVGSVKTTGKNAKSGKKKR